MSGFSESDPQFRRLLNFCNAGPRDGWAHQEGRHRTVVAAEVAEEVAMQAVRSLAEVCEFRDLSPHAQTVVLEGAAGGNDGADALAVQGAGLQLSAKHCTSTTPTIFKISLSFMAIPTV